MQNLPRHSCRGAALVLVLLSGLASGAGPVRNPGFPGTQPQASEQSETKTYLDLLHLANEKTRARQWNQAAELWARVVLANPVEGEIWELLAKARYENKDYRNAIPAFEKAFELRSGFPCNQAYSLAQCYGLLGEKEQSLKWLQKAFELGYRRLDTARTDPALELLRTDNRYRIMAGLADISKMSRDEGWRYDLQFLAREIIRRSYDPFHKLSREEFDATAKKLHDAIPRLTDLQISIEMMKFVAKVGDAHTMVFGFWERPEFLQTIPVELFLFEEGLFITEADSRYEDLLGAQVIRFGGHTIPEVLQALDPIISRDNDMAGLKVMGLMRMRNLPLLHALGVIPDPDKVSLSIKDREGKQRTVTLPANARIPSRKLWDGLPPGWKNSYELSPEPLPLYLKNVYASHWFEYLPETRLVYFQFNRVMDDPKESLARFCDRLFKFINGHEVEKLVIDLRWNPGGDTYLLTPLIHGLIRCEKLNQRGRLFTIIGRRTFSAAQNAATFIERHTNAIFVGEPTGSSPNFIGEETEAHFDLPFSKLTVNVSYLFWQSSWPTDYRPWIAPLIYTPPRFELYRANRDPAMEAILAYR